jgi:hypothetical protein
MKRHNLIIIALLALTLCVTGAMAQDSKLNSSAERAPVTPQNELSPLQEAAPVPIIPSQEGWTNNETPYAQGGNEVPTYGKGQVNKTEPVTVPNDPGNVTPPYLPGDVTPQSGEVAPMMGDERPYHLGLLPTQPQLQPAPPPRGVTPVPPPNPGGPQWGEGKKPIRWFMFPKALDDNN